MAVNKYSTQTRLLYLFIIILLISISGYFIFYNIYSKANTPKCLFVLHGGTFNIKDEKSVIQKDDPMYIGQKIATLSQSDFINNIKQIYGIESDVILSTFSKSHKNEVKNWLYDHCWTNDWNIKIVMNKEEKELNEEEKDKIYLDNAIKMIDTKTIKQYKFIVFIKCNAYLKPEILNYFDPALKKLTFVAKRNLYDHSQINTTVSMIPSKYYRNLFMQNEPFQVGLSIGQYAEKCGFKDEDGIHFWLDNFVNIEDKNPIYQFIADKKE